MQHQPDDNTTKELTTFLLALVCIAASNGWCYLNGVLIAQTAGSTFAIF
jgi:hypothetical protein